MASTRAYSVRIPDGLMEEFNINRAKLGFNRTDALLSAIALFNIYVTLTETQEHQ
ncbi:hypothetical protein H6G80_28480 [Nostoc sp. FACHB-87]|uniref:hypothetical protein n=1 Tax=Nostocaceae TaxID=1162 RepID=UPI001688EB61|nr:MULTISPECIES: hypothetical protein [Nostocaceae]MBD2457989.1 hypothetical protein [Nostoc sp. FACHB-87]MBD2479234.1 hypothetical protein [Anabaena sp. FACHB-83]